MREESNDFSAFRPSLLSHRERGGVLGFPTPSRNFDSIIASTATRLNV